MNDKCSSLVLYFSGPGSYVYKEDSIKKFKKSTFPKLAPRQNVGKPRGIVSISNGDVVMDRSKDRLSYGNRLKLDLQKDPLKTNIAVSIGEKRPELKTKQELSVGPGYYNDMKAFPFLGPQVLSPSKINY